ncbi:MAG TPA: hypothetical protein VJ892_02290 [Candidatus Absconditabacterales bacterium]|nr:hypothetical protein [Candidatus Absconditabacterales bacterium]
MNKQKSKFMKKKEKFLILDLTKPRFIPSVPSAHESPAVLVYDFWTEKGERVEDLKRIKHDTFKILIKKDSINNPQTLKIPKHQITNLLNYFKNRHKKQFNQFECFDFQLYLELSQTKNIPKYTIKKEKEVNFKPGELLFMGRFIKFLGITKTIVDIPHGGICITNYIDFDKNERIILFLSKLGPKEVIVTTLDELKKIYFTSKNYAKIIWKN